MKMRAPLGSSGLLSVLLVIFVSLFLGDVPLAEAQTYKGSLKLKDDGGGPRPPAKKTYTVLFRGTGSSIRAKIGNTPTFVYKGYTYDGKDYFYGESSQYSYSRGCKGIIGLEGDGPKSKSMYACVFLNVDCDDSSKSFLYKYCGTFKR